MDDVIGPDQGVSEWRLDVAADQVLQIIAERADDSDAHGINRELLDSLANVGLLGSPLEPAAHQREVAERIAMADASVWFCWAQHQTPLRMLAAAQPADHCPLVVELQERWLDGLQSGRFLGAVAFAHLRRPGQPNPVAERVPGGWSISGRLDWVTSWDIADVMAVMVRGSGDYVNSVITFYMAAGQDPVYLPGMHVHEPLKLLAMSGTHTRPISFDDVVIPDSNVVSVLDFDQWSVEDERKTIDVNPATFGVIRGAVQELTEIAAQKGDARMNELAGFLTARARELRNAAYEAIEEDGPRDKRVHMRVAALRMAVQATTSVVISRAGAAMRHGCSAERRLREAMFLQVQAQTAVTRDAALALMMNEEAQP